MILITRAIEDALPLQEELAKLNIESHIESLFNLQPLSFDCSILVGARIVVTSKNAIRALSLLDASKDLNIYTMTDNIAKFAKDLEFFNVSSCGCNTVEELEKHIISTFDKSNRFIYLSGMEITRDIVFICNAYGFTFERLICYKMNAREKFSEVLVELLRTARVKCISIFSRRAAVVCRSLLTDYRFEPNLFHYFLMSNRVASVLDYPNIHVPPFPTQSALIDIIRNHYYTEQEN
ncbi:uroporphyrinogen-III synthase HemD family protein [Neorickettsia helminthoeca str. Oregon]|uniref:Uroporphyrinogen-III synthase HemD family protein n=1 Tax=Neorickettsia helminthoeca str. Oregon TaxID=1286528 RepID=X5H468_9RICK|nr:uroporphyrinogen-III synthase [Neorickettsia helminthoeca]AHX11361.1 uroporphyrinogen-III synthase HemD family protein [Neorickettsia helminthoeca str. Oregon]